MSRVLVTGADGFIGRAVCAALADKGHHVIAGTRTGRDVPGAHESRALGDIAHPEGRDRWVADTEIIVHLAARAHVTRDTSLATLGAFRRVNVDGTRALAETAARRGIQRIVYLSTVKVHGETTTDNPFVETDIPDPHDAYAVSKWEAEQLLADIGSRNQLETVVLRAPLVYGPGVKANFLSLLKWCDTPLPLPFGGITRNRRSLLYSGNLAHAISVALWHQKAAGQVFLVSDGPPVSTAQLVRMLRAALGRPDRLLSVSPGMLRRLLSLAGKADACDRLIGSLEVDSSAIAGELSWHPPTSLQAGIQATASWYLTVAKNRE